MEVPLLDEKLKAWTYWQRDRNVHPLRCLLHQQRTRHDLRTCRAPGTEGPGPGVGEREHDPLHGKLRESDAAVQGALVLVPQVVVRDPLKTQRDMRLRNSVTNRTNASHAIKPTDQSFPAIWLPGFESFEVCEPLSIQQGR